MPYALSISRLRQLIRFSRGCFRRAALGTVPLPGGAALPAWCDVQHYPAVSVIAVFTGQIKSLERTQIWRRSRTARPTRDHARLNPTGASRELVRHLSRGETSGNSPSIAPSADQVGAVD